MNDLKQLEKSVGVKFKNIDLLRQSMVHRSYLNENPGFGLPHNERLEHLFIKFPETPEGDLTNWRASLVNSKMLSLVAQEVELEGHLYLSRGEAKDSNSKARQYILANAVEALIGAIYLDQGIKKSSEFVHKKIISKLENILENELYLDPKSKFQEKAQELYKTTPHYKVLSETGPDHDKVFEVGLYLSDELVCRGRGSSKQEAQVDAADKGLKEKKW